MKIQLQKKPRWTKTLIRQARKTDLAPILINRGYRLQPLKNNNYEVRCDQNGKSLAGLVIKNNYWICYDNKLAKRPAWSAGPSTGSATLTTGPLRAGNSIDFFMKIEGLSFHQAMKVIAPGTDYDASERISLQKTVIARL